MNVEWKLARRDDLPGLQAMYRTLIGHMDRTGVSIWDEIYPCCALEGDIQRRRLNVLWEGGVPAAAFALCDTNGGAECVGWAEEGAAALYLDRLAVNPAFLRRGVGGAALERALALAGSLGASYLRLFVVDENAPAVRLYEKHGFQRARGVYEEDIGAGAALREYGYEKRTPGTRGRP